MRIYIDIETIPDQDVRPGQVSELDVAAMIKMPKSIKTEKGIAKWKQDYPNLLKVKVQEEQAKRYDEWLKTALASMRCQIVCICWAINDGEVHCINAGDLNLTEKELLENFFFQTDTARAGENDMLKWYGHNILGFDLPCIMNAAVRNGLATPYPVPWDAKPWSDEVIDTMFALPFTGKDSKKLDDIFQAVGLPAKTSHGIQVYDWWQAGQWQHISDHCMTDVSRHRELCNLYRL